MKDFCSLKKYGDLETAHRNNNQFFTFEEIDLFFDFFILKLVSSLTHKLKKKINDVFLSLTL